MAEERQERRKRFFMQLTLGSILTIISVIGASAGIYAQLYADVSTAKSEIVNIKQNEIKKETADREFRDNIKADVRETKQEVKEIRQDVQQILQELVRQRR